MATVTAVTATTSTLNTTSYASAATTPAANDLLLVFVHASGTVSTGTMTDSQALGFSLVCISRDAVGVNTNYLFVANALAAASSMTVTFNCSDDAATGAAISILRVSGMSRVGLSAIRQCKTISNQASSTPAPAFDQNALTGNPCIGMIGNSTSAATMTPPTGWTEGVDVGYATPTTGLETAFIASGFTSTTVTWGSSSASAWGGIIAEVDTSSATGLLIDALSVTNGILTGTSLTWTHVCTGSNRALYVLLAVVDNSTNRDIVSGVTYNSVAMKYLGRIPDFGGSELFNSIWELVAPTTGSNSIVVTFSADVSVSSSVPTAAAISFTGVHQSYPHKLPATASSGTTNSTSLTATPTDVSTSDGDYIIGSAISHSVNIIPTGSAMVIASQSGFGTGTNQGFTATVKPAAINTSLNSTQGTSDVWSAMAIAVRPATATPTTPQLDQATLTGKATAASSATINSLAASGAANGLLLYSASYKVVGGGAANISSISWNSLALTKKDEQRITVGSDIWATEFWYLLNPPAASATLTATLSTTIADFVHAAGVYSLVDQSTPFGTVAKANQTATPDLHPTVTVTSQVGAIVQDVLVTKGDPTAYTVQTGSRFWSIEDATAPGDTSGSGQAKIGAASVTMDYNIQASGGTTEWGIMGVGINFGAPSTAILDDGDFSLPQVRPFDQTVTVWQ